MEFPVRITAIAAATLLTAALAASPARAIGSPDPAPNTPAPAPTTTTTTTDEKKDAAKPEEKKPEAPKAREDNFQNFVEGYRGAYALIQNGDYEAGIAALRALHQDTHPDVANYLGYSSRKLGRYDDAKRWYEAALASDPRHTRTWQYYGLWHLEQGNRLKAEEHLEKIQLICGGPNCDDYKSLKHAIDSGRASY
jgi:tetratricopeptide (TPR) repeat protein